MIPPFQKNKEMTFNEIYKEEMAKNNGARPLEWLQRIAVAAIVSTDTVYSWVTGWRNPSKSAAALVSRELGIPSEELFPKGGAQ